jgi:REP element-mobilizing transposase RayT
MGNTYRSLAHSKYECKYHVVFVPKYRRKALYARAAAATRADLATSWRGRRSARSSRAT